MTGQPRQVCWIDNEPCPLGDAAAPACIWELTCPYGAAPVAQHGPARPDGLLARVFRKDRRQAHQHDPRQGGPR